MEKNEDQNSISVKQKRRFWHPYVKLNDDSRGYITWLKNVRKAHQKFSDLSSAGDNKPLDRGLLWNEYKLHIDLYIEYIKIVATFDAFYYGVTGAFLSYFFTNGLNIWALIFPIAMSLFFAWVFYNSWCTFKKVKEEVEYISIAFGFTRPEVNTLSLVLLSSAIMFGGITVALLFYMIIVILNLI